MNGGGREGRVRGVLANSMDGVFNSSLIDVSSLPFFVTELPLMISLGTTVVSATELWPLSSTLLSPSSDEEEGCCDELVCWELNGSPATELNTEGEETFNLSCKEEARSLAMAEAVWTWSLVSLSWVGGAFCEFCVFTVLPSSGTVSRTLSNASQRPSIQGSTTFSNLWSADGHKTQRGKWADPLLHVCACTCTSKLASIDYTVEPSH